MIARMPWFLSNDVSTVPDDGQLARNDSQLLSRWGEAGTALRAFKALTVTVGEAENGQVAVQGELRVQSRAWIELMDLYDQRIMGGSNTRSAGPSVVDPGCACGGVAAARKS